MDGLAKLAVDHVKVRELANRLDFAATAGDDEAVAELVREITAELNALAAVEEEVLYPALVELAPELKSQVDHALDEHLLSKELLYEARSGEPSSSEATPDPGLVALAIHHHLSDEALIGSISRVADDGRLGELARAVEDRTATMEEASAAGRAVKDHEELDRAGETDRKEVPDRSAPAARFRNQ